MTALARALELLYVPRCAACDVRVPTGQPLCPPCASSLVELGPACPRCAEPLAAPPAVTCARCARGDWPLESTAAPWRFGGDLARALRRLKFERRPDLARELAPLVTPFLAAVARAGEVGLVVPVPLHWRRLAERGFNPAQALVASASKRGELAVPVDAAALRRVRATAPQTGLSAAERERNLRKAFRVAPRHVRRVAGRRVLLVDDVITTGATLAAAARALRDAGALAVLGFAVARAGD
ncbi:MAG: ComF family protein [Kofleriaceae bacterium]|nr:ComF family protein [Kofleriaceae bacterium]MCL4223981.1 ComF family protein [Myxococcales bacterium]